MLESERLAYLNALGITQYVSLAPIDGAPVLPALAPEAIWPGQPEPAFESEPALEPEPIDAAPEPVAKAKPDPEHLPESTPVAEPATTSMPAAEPGDIPQLDVGKLKQAEQATRTTQPKPAAAPAQRFALAVVTVPDQFRLFVELALPDAPGLSAVEHRMLSDLLALLGHPNGLDQYGAKLYRWPMINNPRLAANPDAARDGLLGFVASAPPVPRSVFLGAKAATLLSDAALGQPFALGQPQPNAVATHSLLAMQQDWTQKATAWQHLRAFLDASDQPST